MPSNNGKSVANHPKNQPKKPVSWTFCITNKDKESKRRKSQSPPDVMLESRGCPMQKYYSEGGKKTTLMPKYP